MKICLIILLLFKCSIIEISGEKVNEYSPGLWICTGLRQGTQIPHPENCSLYFVCNNGYPDLIKCEDQLHYDRHFKVCNWAEYANCRLGEYPPYWNMPHPTQTTIENLTTIKIVSNTTIIEPTTTTRTTIEPTTTISSTTIEPTTTSPTTTTTTLKPTTTTTITPTTKLSTTTTNCITSPGPTPTKPPSNSTTGAKDDIGNLIDPLEKYNPLNVQCFHNGLYFLPHPANCDKYFICSNHILYLHQCGYGTNWNYKYEECQLPHNSKCYYYDQIVNKSTTRKRKIKPPTAPPTAHQTTIKEEIHSTTTIIQDKLPECPTNEQKFLAHPTDCTKYYICIAGLPALTTCPNGMYWDEREEWCGYPEFTYCRAAIVKLPKRKQQN